ncbi:porin [Rubritalea tangerina]|uniref:Porin n=2 Tax=Rubritalea tangerina TaxID=430798 RepID=A0ABW4Z8J8_9BACT
MNNKVVTTMIGAAALSGAAYAGPAPVVAEEKSCGSWCDTLETIGTVYSSKENPYIQKVKFFGRAQVQYAYVDASDVNGKDYHADFDEVRRLRFGGEVKFLNGFKLKANANFEDDDKPSGGERKFGYQSFDQAKLSYTFKDFLGLEKSSVTYGRHKVALGMEQHTSSKKIKTVERSGLANKLTDGRGTGVTFGAERGAWEGTLGFFSTDNSGELLTGWDEGVAFYASTGYGFSCGDLLLDFMYNDQDTKTADSVLYDQVENYEWALSAAYMFDAAGWDFGLNAVYGDNGKQSKASREGSFYGFIGLATYKFWEDKLELVGRYAWQGASKDEGIRVNSRYLRRLETISSDGDFNGGRGDSHHSLYGGLNWYMCGDRSKVMTGIEYDNLSTEPGSVDGLTYWLAYRMYF